MYIVAHYRITDPEEFQDRAGEPMSGRPRRWRLISAAPTRDGCACFNLWWADSAEALQSFLLQAIGGSASVECHEVDEENAMALEKISATLVQIPRS